MIDTFEMCSDRETQLVLPDFLKENYEPKQKSQNSATRSVGTEALSKAITVHFHTVDLAVAIHVAWL